MERLEVALARARCCSFALALIAGCSDSSWIPPPVDGLGVNIGPAGSGDGGDAVDLTPWRHEVVEFDAVELATVATLSPLPAVPADTTNAHADDPAAATLGQRLFFESAYAGPLKVASDLGEVGQSGKISCASCHSGFNFDDVRSMPENVSLGADFHTRNAPALVNSAFYRWGNWGGRFSAQWELPLAVAENPVIMNSSRVRIAHVIFDRHRSAYEAVFGPLDAALGTDPARFPPEGKPRASTAPDGAWEAMSEADRTLVNQVFVNFGKALQAYVRKLISRDSAFDRFVAGDPGAMTLHPKRGLKLFLGKAGCVRCHNGPTLSDGAFHNLGVPQVGEHVPASDDGRSRDLPALLASPFSSGKLPWSDDANTGRLDGLTNTPADVGAFRTPSLRGVTLTGPFMHAGQLATLVDVINFYDRGGDLPASGSRDPQLQPLNLSEQERRDLLSFLGSLKTAAIPAELRAAPTAY